MKDASLFKTPSYKLLVSKGLAEAPAS
jgi:hypothetical protein